jgi:uncharacterized membrane protein/thiol-disulfide isomerase/thioredoxin
MKPLTRSYLAVIILLTGLFFSPRNVNAQEPLLVVRAVLFFSPTCPHCHTVINETLPPILERFGNQLQIVGIDTQTSQGQTLYLAALEKYQVPQERSGVPSLYIGETYLVGEIEIPEQLPGLIEQGLAAGGIDWPDIPGLAEVVAEVDFAAQTESGGDSVEQKPATQEPTAEESATPIPTETADVGLVDINHTELKPPSMLDMFQRDPAGNTVAVVVLAGMLLVIGYIIITINKPAKEKDPWPHWLIPVLVAIGLFVAGYLSYVETTHTEAACGPLGDCNTVQQSPFAILFGFLPVGILGLIGCSAILVAWILQYYGPRKFRNAATIALWGMAMFGTMFSIYLTYLEPFVIGATCLWCITSAIVQTAILWLATPPVKRVWELADLEEDEEEEEIETP